MPQPKKTAALRREDYSYMKPDSSDLPEGDGELQSPPGPALDDAGLKPTPQLPATFHQKSSAVVARDP
ncbi:MAG: hypothetical protein KKB70_00480, partial [Proteobacteria bacterium]|nr:hypothetical protein [Pseudomonadota bacterium]